MYGDTMYENCYSLIILNKVESNSKNYLDIKMIEG